MKKIPLMSPHLMGNEKKYILDAVDSTWIGGAGAYIDRVEREWAEICCVKECVTSANGTVALHLALLAFGAGPGDEVIVPALTYVATANAVRYVGAEPVFVDVDPDTWCIDPRKIEAAITRRTKGIMPVHLHGHPADIDPVRKLANLYKLWIICDAAQAHMATYKGKSVGSLGDIETFSFHVGKVFTCGEGGALTLNDSNLAAWLRMIRGHGMDPDRRFFHPMPAFNYRLTNMQAAVLCAQFESRDSILEQRNQVFKRYRANLAGVPGVGMQPIAPWAVPCPWFFTITIDDRLFGCSRDMIMAALADKGIESRPFYVPLHQLPHYRELAIKRGDTCPEAERLSRIGLTLPSSTALANNEIDFIVEIVLNAVKR
jgi:perosamine synthetase